MKPEIIIIDDEKEITDSYSIFLKRAGRRNFLILNDAKEFVNMLDDISPAAVFLDLHMPFYTGEELLEMVKEKHPAASVIILTGSNEIETAVRCLHKGALDYIVKPIDKDRFAAALDTAFKTYEMNTEISALRLAIRGGVNRDITDFHGILTKNRRMKELFRYVEAASASSFPVLITGETGVGKELFAKAVHECSGRKGRFIAVNVSGLDDTMFSDTLFGHVKGAFTGADKVRNGLMSEADGGTLFLDEIGDLAETAQIKLLRLIQEKVFMPLGSDRNQSADVRIVAATNADLESKVKSGTFRRDLLYRLSTHCVAIPPLRERQEDIPCLADMFYRSAMKDIAGFESGIPAHAAAMIRSYGFPGNVRQLQAVVSDMAVVFRDLSPSDRELVSFLTNHGIDIRHFSGSENNAVFTYSGIFPTLKEMEQHLVDSAVKSCGGCITSAASLLGITRQALHKRLRQTK